MDGHKDCNKLLFDKERGMHILAKDVESLKKSVEEIKCFLGIQSSTDNGPADNGPTNDNHSSRIIEDCCKDSGATDNCDSDYEIKVCSYYKVSIFSIRFVAKCYIHSSQWKWDVKNSLHNL